MRETPACLAGETGCVDETIAEMQRRLQPLVAACDHAAVFALNYLRTTEEYRRTIEDPTAFDDVAFVNRLDGAFAQLYFDAFDAYADGRLDAVPPAWRIAFDAAAAGEVTAVGDALLGISAHVNRDLPFALDHVGVTGPDGRSRRADFDAFNDVLLRVLVPIVQEIAQRFDPAILSPTLDGQPLDFERTLALVDEWRDAAFRNAERLHDAATDAVRRAVVEEIEDGAAAIARSLRAGTAASDAASVAARDAHCATHGAA